MNHSQLLSSTQAAYSMGNTSASSEAYASHPPSLSRKASIRKTPLTTGTQRTSVESHIQPSRNLPHRNLAHRNLPDHNTSLRNATSLSRIASLQSFALSPEDQSSDQSSMSSDQSRALTGGFSRAALGTADILLQAESSCMEHRESIQTFLKSTQTELTHYFDAQNNSKTIEIDTRYPSFLANSMNYSRMEEVATMAFKNAGYVKDNPRDGCYARAELAGFELDTHNQRAGKIFATGDCLSFKHHKYQNIAWAYHVAATAVSENGTLFVIDPCVSEKPILLHHWLETFVVGDAVKLTFTHARYEYSSARVSTFFPLNGTYIQRAQKAQTALNELAQKGHITYKQTQNMSLSSDQDSSVGQSCSSDQESSLDQSFFNDQESIIDYPQEASSSTESSLEFDLTNIHLTDH